MKRIVFVLLCGILSFSLCACASAKTGQDSTGQEELFETLPQSFVFSSGVGAWSTDLNLNSDGTFTGEYHDSDMGDAGSEYPGGTVYICKFSGKFTAPVRVDAYTYSMKLAYLNTEGTIGDKYYENGIRYIYSAPYGLEDADELLVYLPGTRISNLPEGFVSWLHAFVDVKATKELPFWGIYNVGGEKGFVAYDADASD